MKRCFDSCKVEGDEETVERQLVVCGPLITAEDFTTALEHLQASQLDGIGTAKVCFNYKFTASK